MPGDERHKAVPILKSAKDDFGVLYLVATTGVTPEQAMTLVDRFGLDFDALELEAARINATTNPEPGASKAQIARRNKFKP